MTSAICPRDERFLSTPAPSSRPNPARRASAAAVVFLFAVFAILLVAAQSDAGREGADVLDGRGKWSGYLAAPAVR